MAETEETEIQETVEIGMVEIGKEIGVEVVELMHTVVLGDGAHDVVGIDEGCRSLLNVNVV